YLQQGLLYAFAGDVTGNRRIFVLATDLIDLIYVNDAGLGATHIAIGRLQQLEDDVLNVFADVACLSESGSVNDGEGNIEHLGQRLCQERLAGTGWPYQQNVALGKLHLAVALAIHVDALVVVVDRDRQLLFGLFLADHILVEEYLDLLRFRQVIRGSARTRLGAVVFQDGVANCYALIADVGTRVITGGRD